MLAFACNHCRLPSHVLLVPADVPALDPQQASVPQLRPHLVLVCALYDRDALTKNCDSVAGLDTALFATTDVPRITALHKQVEPNGVIARLASPKRQRLLLVSDE
jgi:hypothetical protein